MRKRKRNDVKKVWGMESIRPAAPHSSDDFSIIFKDYIFTQLKGGLSLRLTFLGHCKYTQLNTSKQNTNIIDIQRD